MSPGEQQLRPGPVRTELGKVHGWTLEQGCLAYLDLRLGVGPLRHSTARFVHFVFLVRGNGRAEAEARLQIATNAAQPAKASTVYTQARAISVSVPEPDKSIPCLFILGALKPRCYWMLNMNLGETRLAPP